MPLLNYESWHKLNISLKQIVIATFLLNPLNRISKNPLFFKDRCTCRYAYFPEFLIIFFLWELCPFECKSLHSKSRHPYLRHEHLRHACLGCLHINVFVHVSSISRHLPVTICKQRLGSNNGE